MRSLAVLAGARRLECARGDLVTESVDAIVNGASESLIGGHGLDRAVHAAAGMALTEECRKIGACAVGSAVLTGAHRLRATYVIHAVGPKWQGGGAGEAETLAATYRSAFALAKRKQLRTIAFHAISTGANGYPPLEAASVAFETILDELLGATSLKVVRFVLISSELLTMHGEVAKSIAARRGLWCVEDDKPIGPDKEA